MNIGRLFVICGLVLCLLCAALLVRIKGVVNYASDMVYEMASLHGDIKAAQRLVQYGIDLNAKNGNYETPLHNVFRNCIAAIIIPVKSEPVSKRLFVLIELLSWYLYHTCTNTINISKKNQAKLLKYLKAQYSSFLVSNSKLEGADALLSWMMNRMLNCRSKTELIERILEYLETTGESAQNALVENMHYLLSQEEILEELHSNFNEFKMRYSLHALNILNDIFRYKYAQEVKRKIFDALDVDESIVNQLMDLTDLEIENNKEHMAILTKIQENLINYCNDTQIKSFFVKTIIEYTRKAETEKIIKLAQEYTSSSEVDNIDLEGISKINTDSTLMLIKDVKTHLEYIIQQKGMCFDSPTLFGAGTGQDIILLLEREI